MSRRGRLDPRDNYSTDNYSHAIHASGGMQNVRGVFFYVTRFVLDLIDHSVPALANCPGTERWDRSSGPERLGQNVHDFLALHRVAVTLRNTVEENYLDVCFER